MNNKQNFIDKSNEIHKFKYNYSKVLYFNNKTAVEIVCKPHGSFYQRPDSHSNGQGCKKCSIENRRVKQKIPIEIFKKKSLKFHKNKYDYSV